ncbi:hypothetical protein AN958_07628 [Leucoagaricus sp. SymC.cos]|nr:hypothetical protein AN958_07628 [Leucoagaricus sp. SymC.cos]
MPPPDSLAPGIRDQSGNDNSSLDNFTTDVVVDDAITESEPDAEEEIDQLDSDSDVPPEQPPDAPAPSVPKRPSQARSGERRVGQTLLPAVRVENILQAEGLTGNINLSKEAVFLFSIATEEFIRNYSKLAHGRAQFYNRNMVRYDDLAKVTESRSNYRFLRDTIPVAVSLALAFAARSKREKDLFRDDPAMQFQDGHTQPPGPPSPRPTPLVDGQNIVVIESASGSNSASSSRMKSKACPPRSTARKAQSSKAAAPTPPPGASSTSSTSKRPFVEPTETWEEWKEKARLLYSRDPIEITRQRQTQPPSVLSAGALDPIEVPNPPEPSRPSGQPLYEGDPRSEHTSPASPRTDYNNDYTPRAYIEYEKGHPKKPRSKSGQNTAKMPSRPLTGPGSAFLHGPGGFTIDTPPEDVPWESHTAASGTSSSSVPPPGRTIYSTGNETKENAV